MTQPRWDGRFDEWIPEHWYARKLLGLLSCESGDTAARMLDYALKAVGNDIDTKLMREIVESELPYYREIYRLSEALRKEGVVVEDHEDFRKLAATALILAYGP